MHIELKFENYNLNNTGSCVDFHVQNALKFSLTPGLRERGRGRGGDERGGEQSLREEKREGEGLRHGCWGWTPLARRHVTVGFCLLCGTKMYDSDDDVKNDNKNNSMPCHSLQRNRWPGM